MENKAGDETEIDAATPAIDERVLYRWVCYHEMEYLKIAGQVQTCLHQLYIYISQLAGAIEYIDCISAEG